MTDDEHGMYESYGIKPRLSVRFTDISWENGAWCKVADDGNIKILSPWIPTHWHHTSRSIIILIPAHLSNHLSDHNGKCHADIE